MEIGFSLKSSCLVKMKILLCICGLKELHEFLMIWSGRRIIFYRMLIACLMKRKRISTAQPFKILISIWINRERGEREEESEEYSEEESEEPVIKTIQSFKSDGCVICLDNPPNILFCNCGHIPICAECDELNNYFGICPICKTKNTIKRNIENYISK